MHPIFLAGLKEALAPVQVFRFFTFPKYFSPQLSEMRSNSPGTIGQVNCTQLYRIVLPLLLLLAAASWLWGPGLVWWSRITLLDSGVPERLPHSSYHGVFFFLDFLPLWVWAADLSLNCQCWASVGPHFLKRWGSDLLALFLYMHCTPVFWVCEIQGFGNKVKILTAMHIWKWTLWSPLAIQCQFS